MNRATPVLRVRIAASLALALVGVAVFLGRIWLTGEDPAGDLEVMFLGVRRLLLGENIFRTHPYVLHPMRSVGTYPLPAFMLVAPLVVLPQTAAAAVFVLVTTFAAAFLLSRDGLMRLWLFASFGAFKAWAFAQWSPLLLCVTVSEWAAPLAMCKPNIGLPLLAGYLRRRGLLAILATLLVAQLLLPTWIIDWLRNVPTVVGVRASSPDIHTSFPYYIPLMLPFGLPLLLAAVRWRQPLGRLMLVQACLPQRPDYYDQLAFGLVPQTTRRMLAFVGLGWAGFGAWGLGTAIFGQAASETAVVWTSVAFAWYPALFCLLVPPRRLEPSADTA